MALGCEKALFLLWPADETNCARAAFEGDFHVYRNAGFPLYIGEESTSCIYFHRAEQNPALADQYVDIP